MTRFFDELAGGPGEGRSTADVAPLDAVSRTIAEELLKEIRGRLEFLIDVGLHYLTLDRSAPTLSGGEAAADPPGQPGRRGAGGRAVHPR